MPHWISTAPISGELLSSYLCRCARRHGMRPTGFASLHLSEFAIWSRDIDRSATQALLSALVSYTGLPYQRIQEMTLHKIQQQLAPNAQSTKPHAGVMSWLTVVGMYHKKRRRHGQQYCAECLRESGAYFQSWRLACVTTCSRHKVLLRDSCPVCGAVVTCHRQQLSAFECDECGADLTQEVRKKDATFLTAESFNAQTAMLDAINGRSVRVAQMLVSATEFLVGMTLLRRWLRVLGLPTSRHETGQKFMALEHQRCEVRKAIMDELQCLLIEWPIKFIAYASKMGVTQRTLVTAHPFPSWIDDAVKQLPAGQSYDRKRRPAALRRALRQVHRHRLPGWRVERAELLLKAMSRNS